MNKKTVNIINWVLAVVLCPFGICLCTKASFGLSMIAAPPYIIHCFVREMLPWYTQGTSEYIWQTFIIIITCLATRRFSPKFLLSFLTGILTGLVIDLWFLVLGGNGAYESMAVRIAAFVFGSVIISIAIAFVFRTSLPPQAYELIVSEIADRYGFHKGKTKLVNDIIMLVISVLLALLTHAWSGVGVGTVIVTFANAPMINFFGKIIDKVEKNNADAETRKLNSEK
ncbi:MAG: DUF6198 family protein [Clostridia bacterium]|nr:DUF6198 family protein [Clostridia bacterium]